MPSSGERRKTPPRMARESHMVAALIVVRDMIIALALSWIGVSVEPAKTEPCALKGADAGMCSQRGAGFDATGCDLR